MYNTFRPQYHWLHKLMNVNTYGGQCESCKQDSSSGKHQPLLKQFSSRTVRLCRNQYAEPAHTAKQVNRIIVLIARRHTELTKAVLLSKIAASHVSNLAIKGILAPYGSFDTILTDNGKQLTFRIFATLSTSLDTRLATTMEYHPHSNDQLERFYRTFLASL